MVEGLRSIFNNQGSVIAVNMSNGTGRELRTKEEIVLYKGEKMSGALSFLEKIKEIERLNVSMDGYIESILDMNRKMVPELQEVIEEYNRKIKKHEEELDMLLTEKAPLEEFVEYHVEDCMDFFLGENSYSAKKDAEKIMCQISTEFKEEIERLEILNKQESKINSELWNMKQVVSTLSGYVNTINAALAKELGQAV